MFLFIRWLFGGEREIRIRERVATLPVSPALYTDCPGEGAVSRTQLFRATCLRSYLKQAQAIDLAGERDSNPRRAFDPYTLSRVVHESKAVYTILIFALFLVILSTPVHSRLQKTFRTVPYRPLCTHGRSVSQALLGLLRHNLAVFPDVEGRAVHARSLLRILRRAAQRTTNSSGKALGTACLRSRFRLHRFFSSNRGARPELSYTAQLSGKGR